MNSEGLTLTRELLRATVSYWSFMAPQGKALAQVLWSPGGGGGDGGRGGLCPQHVEVPGPGQSPVF